MAWRDTLREASFRGVRFLVESHELEGGRRGETHEYPQRDEPYAEDTGRRARRYELEAFVLGASYTPLRDQLVTALEAAGPGTLVHPYLGTTRVVVRAYRLTESTQDGGQAKFRITFEEAGRNQYPGGSIATDAAVKDQADAAAGGVLADLERVLDAAAPGWLTNDAVDFLIAGADAIAGAMVGITSIAGDHDALRRALVGFPALASSLALDPAETGATVRSLLVQLRTLPGSPGEAFRALMKVASWKPPESVPETTPLRLRQKANRAALTGFVRRSALIEAAVAVTSIEFEAREDAARVREEITAALDEEILTAGAVGDDAGYRELSKLYAAVATDLERRGATLESIQVVRLPASVPALVLAHRLYRDALRDQEIVARNRVRHPSFVPGGTDLEVLTDAA
jgi:prophage DNA circulation protein